MSKVTRKLFTKISAAAMAIAMVLCMAPSVSFAKEETLDSVSYSISVTEDGVALYQVCKDYDTLYEYKKGEGLAKNEFSDTVFVKSGGKVDVTFDGEAGIHFYNEALNFELTNDVVLHWQSEYSNSKEKYIVLTGDSKVTVNATAGRVDVIINKVGTEPDLKNGLTYVTYYNTYSTAKLDVFKRNDATLPFYKDSGIDKVNVPAGTKLTVNSNIGLDLFVNNSEIDLTGLEGYTSDRTNGNTLVYTVTAETGVAIYATPSGVEIRLGDPFVADTDPEPDAGDDGGDDTKGDAQGTGGQSGTGNGSASGTTSADGTGSAAGSNNGVVAGGDSVNMVMWIALFVVSGGCIAAVANKKRGMNR